ncbi:hypothetical protein BGW41_000887 [Actinomortierella wolfii]|nr:hypothetical protein BGW41_000887 [Actinomortierella wolfii]
MATLKYELEQWNEGVIAFDEGDYDAALEIFEPIADSAKIHFNIGVVLATLGDFEGASAAYEQATKLDKYLAIAYFQNGVANVALEDYAKALTCFHDAFLYLRGNMVIDYTQLGLDFKLYSCQVLFNRALCYIELGEMDLAMNDLWRASREKQTKAHDILDQALRDKGQDCTVFTVPHGVLYRPPESKVKNSKKKDYLGNSKVVAALDAGDTSSGFQGKSAWQVQLSGPTNVAVVEERPMTPPNGLQRRATERVVGARGRRGTDPERPQLEHSASFSGLDVSGRRAQQAGPGPSNLGPAGSEPRSTGLMRRNTEANRPPPLNLEGRSNGRTGPASAAAMGYSGRFPDDTDDLNQRFYDLGIDSQDMNVGDPIPPVPALPSSQTANSSPMSSSEIRTAHPTRLNNNSNGAALTSKPSLLRRNPSQNRGMSPSPQVAAGVNGVPPLPRSNSSAGQYYSTSPPMNGLRRMGSSGLRREDSVRSAASGSSGGADRGYGNYYSNGRDEMVQQSYLDEPVYAGLRDKLRVKCHYTDTRAVLVRQDTTLQELMQKVQEKFQSDRPLRLKYKDEDNHMLSMIDDDDWLMAQQVHMETMGNLDRMELWVFDDDD